MGSPAVTITPDPPQQVTITPDAPPAQPSAAYRFGNNLLLSAGVGTKEGTKQFFAHPLDTLKAMAQQQGELGIRAKQELQNKDYVRGLTHAVEYLLPGLGPNLAHAGDQLEKGDYAGGAGSTVGAALPLVAGSPEARAAVGDTVGAPIRAAASRAPELYQSALKPSTTIPAGRVASIVNTGLENGIPVSSSGLQKLQSLVTDLNQKIKATIDADPTRPINKFAVTSRLGDTAKRFQTQVNPEADLNAISESGNEFLRNQPAQIPASEAQALKSGTYSQLSSKAYGELKSASIESQKALARGLKEEIANQFPEINALNAQESKLFDLEPALEKAVQRISNHQVIGIGTPLVAAGTKAVTNSNMASAVAGMMKAVIDTPSVKSRLAILLNKAAGPNVPIAAANARVAAYSAALAQAASETSNGSRGNQSTQ